MDFAHVNCLFLCFFSSYISFHIILPKSLSKRKKKDNLQNPKNQWEQKVKTKSKTTKTSPHAGDGKEKIVSNIHSLLICFRVEQSLLKPSLSSSSNLLIKFKPLHLAMMKKKNYTIHVIPGRLLPKILILLSKLNLLKTFSMC